MGHYGYNSRVVTLHVAEFHIGNHTDKAGVVRSINLTSEVLDVGTADNGSQLGARALWAEEWLNGDGRHGGLLFW